jgi:hypothetical protein
MDYLFGRLLAFLAPSPKHLGWPAGSLEASLEEAPMDNEPPVEKSFGNVGEHHWTRTRRGLHREALDYLRGRSRAPGVREGGSARNQYCMSCDGVIPQDAVALTQCPHCGAALEGRVKRYFNWVEIDQPGSSDARALLPWIVGALVLLGLLVWLLARWVLGS